MLTISRLAAYAGVTVRAVRHYHQIGLLPEPERSRSGYRTYDAAAVVRLIRIRTLAEAGVPLARVQELLDAGPEAFARGVRTSTRSCAPRSGGCRATANGSPGSPPESTWRSRSASWTTSTGCASLGIDERYVELERDGWIMVAAQIPEEIDAIIAAKHKELDDPDMRKLYRLISESVDWSDDEPRLVEIADIMERLMIRAEQAGEVGTPASTTRSSTCWRRPRSTSSPLAERLLAILEERGWKGWIRTERVAADGQL